MSLWWRHNGRDSVSNHQPHDCLPDRVFTHKSKKTPKLRVTGLCAGNSSGTSEFPAQMISNAKNVSIWWRHHVKAFQQIPVSISGYYWAYLSVQNHFVQHYMYENTVETTFLGLFSMKMLTYQSRDSDLNTLRLKQNVHDSANDSFKCIFLNENVWIWIKMSLKFVPKGSVNNISALVQIMAWHQPGDKSLSESMILNYQCIYASLGLNELKRRQEWDQLIFIMGIPLLAWGYRFIESGPLFEYNHTFTNCNVMYVYVWFMGYQFSSLTSTVKSLI